MLFVDATGLGTVVERNRRVLTEADIDRIRHAYDEWRERRHSTTYSGLAGFSASVTVNEIQENGDILNPLVYVAPSGGGGIEDIAATVRDLRSELRRLQSRAVEVDQAVDQQLRRVDGWRR
jgi:type I restriction enzyme M protein